MAQADDTYSSNTGNQNSGICAPDPGDMVQILNNFISRIERLETVLGQILGTDISASQLSDLSTDLGTVTAGQIGPAVQIHTEQNYAMYAYGTFLSPSPIEVTGTVEITENTFTSYGSNAFTRDITFKVTNPGLYACLANGSYHIDFSGDQEVSAYIIMQARRESSIVDDLGLSQIGHPIVAQQSATGSVNFDGIWDSAGNAGENVMDFFRLEANSTVRVFVSPSWSDTVNPPLTGATLSLYSLCITLVKICDL